jgi:cation diffusion facilitator CzcD-associated flavoprotein CzcO
VRDPRIVIVGAGMAGIAAAHTFRQSGFTNFTILEKGSDVGGVASVPISSSTW